MNPPLTPIYDHRRKVYKQNCDTFLEILNAGEANFARLELGALKYHGWASETPLATEELAEIATNPRWKRLRDDLNYLRQSSNTWKDDLEFQRHVNMAVMLLAYEQFITSEFKTFWALGVRTGLMELVEDMRLDVVEDDEEHGTGIWNELCGRFPWIDDFLEEIEKERAGLETVSHIGEEHAGGTSKEHGTQDEGSTGRRLEETFEQRHSSKVGKETQGACTLGFGVEI